MSELIRADDPRWETMLAGCPHDFYHLPGYLALSGAYEGGEPRAFYTEVGSCHLLMPMLVRPFPTWLTDTGQDAASPYGYPGPIWNPDAAPRDVAEALGRWVEVGAAHGLVTSFIRLHPVLDDGRAWALVDDDRFRVVDHGPTVGIDLTVEEAAVERSVSRSNRYDIRRLKAKGYFARIDDPRDFEPFQAIYLDTMDRLASSEFYRFGTGYFQGLRRCLGEHYHHIAIVTPEGEVACASILTHVGGVVQGHLGGTARPFLPESPFKFLIVAVRDWGRGVGAKVLHMGGGLGAKEDALYQFKCSFGDLRFRYRTLQIVHQPRAYAALVGPGAGVASDYFPAYRTRFATAA